MRNRVPVARRRIFSLVAALAVATGAVTGTAQATPVGPVDLGTLPGDDESTVLAVNEAGEMVGLSLAGPVPKRSHPVRWDADGRIMALPTPGGTEGQVRAINGLGVSAGYVLTATTAVPARWDAAGNATLLRLPPGYHNATAWAISDTDVVVGSWLTPDDRYHGFRWDPDGVATDLGTLPGETWSMADGISADGTVIVGSAVRSAANQAVRWVDGGPITELAPQGVSSGASRINGDGVAVGTFRGTTSGPPVPAKWDRDGVLHPLDWPSPHSVWIYGIGSTGHVVGSGYLNPPRRSALIWDLDGDVAALPDDGLGADAESVNAHGTVAGTFRSQATVWFLGGERRQLGTLPGGTRSQGYRITDNGRVVGTSANAAGKSHAVYWTLG
ncbi:HAF repeat-containing protein [Amycolatopsis sp. WAC 04182]|uniref:HAF repeat-containing protein n=1 Tax=Amycolatopsis sp. WAC 04182 TaxID=2203198 RepID=UPI000F7ADE3B|nr:HAF repeat-containing protein [Amycolatopsis sp. WAC 04182]RSN54312.1 HAF repeat-containing protein [Amycolatopsis sp. WAC 04182]